MYSVLCIVAIKCLVYNFTVQNKDLLANNYILPCPAWEGSTTVLYIAVKCMEFDSETDSVTVTVHSVLRYQLVVPALPRQWTVCNVN